MDIQAVIAEAQASAETAKAETPAETTAPQSEVETAEQSPKEATEAKEDVGSKPDSELTPEQLAKRERNRQSHLRSESARLRRENRELRKLAEQFNQQTSTSQPQEGGAPVPPSEDNFNTWEEFRAAERKFYEDLADWKIERKLSDRDKKTAEDTSAKAVDAHKEARVGEIRQKTQEFIKEVPEYSELINEYADFFEQIPEHVEAALLEAENTPLAVYTLMKEGLIDQLDGLSPYQIAMAIGKAEIRGEKYLNRNTATNAPAPVAAAKGTGKPTKSFMDMPMDDLLSQFRNRG